MQRFFKKPSLSPETKSHTTVVHFTDVKREEKSAYLEVQFSALEPTHKVVEFPEIDMEKISHFTKKITNYSGCHWMPLLPTLWGQCFPGETSYIWQFYDITLDKEAYINIETEPARYWKFGVAGFDNDTVVIAHSNILDFWKYKDQILQQIASITVENQFNRVMNVHYNFYVKRINSDYIAMISGCNTWSGHCEGSALYVINTTTYQDHARFKLKYNRPKEFYILPTKTSSQFILVVDHPVVRLLEVNTSKKIKIKNHGVMKFEDKITPDEEKGIPHISSTHITSIRHHWGRWKITAKCFEVIEKGNKFATRLVQNIPDECNPINALVRDPLQYEFNNQWIYFRDTSQFSHLLDPSFVYDLVEGRLPISYFYPISGREIAILDGNYALHILERPEYQMNKIEVFFDAMQSSKLSRELVGLSAQYAFGLFAQNPGMVVGEAKDQAVAVVPRIGAS